MIFSPRVLYPYPYTQNSQLILDQSVCGRSKLFVHGMSTSLLSSPRRPSQLMRMVTRFCCKDYAKSYYTFQFDNIQLFQHGSSFKSDVELLAYSTSRHRIFHIQYAINRTGFQILATLKSYCSWLLMLTSTSHSHFGWTQNQGKRIRSSIKLVALKG